jgi:hypothetical protein
MNDGQVRERTVICLTQSGSRERYWLEVQSETSDDWTGLVLTTMDTTAAAPAAGTGVPICFPKRFWREVTTKEVM